MNYLNAPHVHPQHATCCIRPRAAAIFTAHIGHDGAGDDFRGVHLLAQVIGLGSWHSGTPVYRFADELPLRGTEVLLKRNF